MTQNTIHTMYLAQEATVAPAQARARASADAERVTTVTTDGQGQGTTTIYGPIPRGGGRLIVQEDGDRTVFTTTQIPPQMMVLAHRAQQTAFGLMGLLAAIVILGPFARMWARRIEKRGDMNALNAAGVNAQLLQQQLKELQQSVDAMSVEVERISESQRFQSRLLHEKQSV
jgi:hypothetical protein